MAGSEKDGSPAHQKIREFFFWSRSRQLLRCLNRLLVQVMTTLQIAVTQRNPSVGLIVCSGKGLDERQSAVQGWVKKHDWHET